MNPADNGQKPAVALSAELNPAQASLFDDSGDPVCLAVLDAVKLKRYEHTGERLVGDDALALRLVELICLGWGGKKIAREMCISVHTIRAAKKVLEQQKKLAPYKERVVGLFEEIIEVGARNYLDALENGRVQAAQIPVGLGIISDKRALALGEPTMISAPAAAAQDLNEKKINDYFSTLPTCKTDYPSTGKLTEPQQIASTLGADATLDVTGTPARPDNQTAAQAEDGGAGPSQAAGPGGGGTPSAGSTSTNAMGSTEPNHKRPL